MCQLAGFCYWLNYESEMLIIYFCCFVVVVVIGFLFVCQLVVFIGCESVHALIHFQCVFILHTDSDSEEQQKAIDQVPYKLRCMWTDNDLIKFCVWFRLESRICVCDSVCVCFCLFSVMRFRLSASLSWVGPFVEQNFLSSIVSYGSGSQCVTTQHTMDHAMWRCTRVHQKFTAKNFTQQNKR